MLITLITSLIVVFILYDIAVTILSHGGAGPLTKFWTDKIWSLILLTKYRLNLYLPIRIAGPSFIIGIITVWYLLLYFCWCIFLYVGDYSITGKNDPAVSVLDIVYYVGSTFSNLGIGDYVPNRFPWTILTTSGAFLVTLLLSLTVSYVIPVLSALVDRRRLITKINLIGEDTEAILLNAWSGDNANELDSEVLDISDMLIKESYRGYVYPILSHFYFPGDGYSLNLNVLNLLDAQIIQYFRPDRKGNLPRVKVKFMIKAIRLYVKNSMERPQKEYKKFTYYHTDLYHLFDQYNIQNPDEGELRSLLDIREFLLAFSYFEGKNKSINCVLEKPKET